MGSEVKWHQTNIQVWSPRCHRLFGEQGLAYGPARGAVGRRMIVVWRMWVLRKGRRWLEERAAKPQGRKGIQAENVSKV